MTDLLNTQDTPDQTTAQAPDSQAQASMKPDLLPEKFWDPKTGEVRLDELIQSYIALEKKLSGMVPAPVQGGDNSRLHQLLGVPDSPDQYQVNCDHGMFTSDPALNARLHAQGFTQDQVQTVYDLAAEKLVPIILEITADFQADREVEKLTAAFGGPDKWQEASRQLLAFGQKTLPPDVLASLASSYEGVMTLYRMMQGESAMPSPRVDTSGAGGALDLQAMIRDPRYWRQKDPAFVAKVTDGFRQMYGGGQ